MPAEITRLVNEAMDNLELRELHIEPVDWREVCERNCIPVDLPDKDYSLGYSLGEGPNTSETAPDPAVFRGLIVGFAIMFVLLALVGGALLAARTLG